MRFEIRHVTGRFTPHFTLTQNWPSDKGQPVLFPVKPGENLKSYLMLLLEAAWSCHVLPELRKRGLVQEALFAVQVLYVAGKQPFVRLNEEVRVKATILERREGWPLEHVLLLKLKPGFVRQSPTRRIIDMELVNEERARYGHFTCLRVESCWWGVIDFVGLLPQSVQDTIEAWEHSSLSGAIVLSAYGDDSAKDQLLYQLNVDMSSLPEPLNREVSNLVYACVYRACDDTPVQEIPSAITHRITEELSKERKSLDWGWFLSDTDCLAMSLEEASELKQATEQYIIAAGLGRREQDIIKLNVMLKCRGDKWKRRAKAKHLEMSVKSYEKYLRSIRIALRADRRKLIAEGYKHLLDEILKGG